MAKYEPEVAVAVVGLAGFQLLQAWNQNAPSLKDVRSAAPDDISIRQQLMDADYMVGALSLVLGTAFALMTKDITALLVMLIIYGSVSLWWHSVQKADSR